MTAVVKPAAGELIEAVTVCDIERVKFLLEEGADPDERNLNMTALHHAVMFDPSGKLAEILIGKGAGLDVTDSSGLTPLMYAAIYRNNTALGLLIEKGALIDKEDEWGRSALSIACETNDRKAAAILENEFARRAEEKAAREAAEAARKRIADSHETAAARQKALKKLHSQLKVKQI